MLRLIFLTILISVSLAQKYPCECTRCTEEEVKLFETGYVKSKRAPLISTGPECTCMYQFNDSDGYQWLSRYQCDRRG